MNTLGDRILAMLVLLLAVFGDVQAAAPMEKARQGPGAGKLFVGTNYQPVDRTRDQVLQDVARMKRAGFTVVRMGDLSWDYFEPAEGRFEFADFDWIMNQMQAAGIRVILDIPGQPAPTWLHHEYPGVDIVTQQGVRLHAAERYMDDIADPDYRRLLGRLAETLMRRYAAHPALFAVGYNNEIGNGFLSYSAADRDRFVDWLKKKYGSIAALNKAWATQRWSRHVNTWEEVELPYGDGPGPFERQLDLRRYWSDVTIDVLRELDAIRARYIPNKPAISNLWDWSERKGFDYLSTYRDYASHGAMGFYPGDAITAGFDATMMKAGMSTPIWFNEFTAGGGGYYGTRGRSRMWAHMGLLLGAQAVLAWTWHSHHGGEEQALFGLIDHDDRESWKLNEFGRIAGEFAKLEKLEKLGFPRDIRPEVAIAYSFENTIASEPRGPSNTVRQYIRRLRTNEFYDAKGLNTRIGPDDVSLDIGFHEVLEPSTAEVLARFTNIDGMPPSVTVNRFGRGRAIYVATPAQTQIMRPLYRQLYATLGIRPGPKTPDGVYARVVDGRTLYVNTTGEPKEIPIEGTLTGLLSGKKWSGSVVLEALDADLLAK